MWLFGALAALAAERPLTLRLAPEATAGDVIDALGRRLGRPFRDLVVSEPGALFRCCRLFADGRPVETLAAPISPDGAAVEIELLLLMGYEGG